MENNFIFVIIIVIVVIIIIVAFSNKGDEITHHHAKPHFDQPKNVMRIKTSRHIRNYKVFKVVMNDHSEQTDPEETVYKGHEPDLSATNLVQIGAFNNTVAHGTDVAIPLDGEVNNHDPGQLIVEGTTTNGRIDTLATTTSNTSNIRTYTVTFQAGSYRPPIPPLITGIDTFHITIKKGSKVSITNLVISPADTGNIDTNLFSLLSCGVTGLGDFVCDDINNY